MTDQKQGRTSRYRNAQGVEVYASQGGVRQHGGSLPIYVCNTCGNHVVWVESRRTGRKYLCEVSTGASGRAFYMGHHVHKCDEIMAQRAAWAWQETWNRNRDAMLALRDAVADEFYDARDAGDQARMDAAQEGLWVFSRSRIVLNHLMAAAGIVSVVEISDETVFTPQDQERFQRHTA